MSAKPILYCANTNNILHKYGYRLSCGHWLYATEEDVTVDSVFCQICGKTDHGACIFCTECYSRSCHCMLSTTLCTLNNCRSSRCRRKSVYNNAGYCKEHLCWSGVQRFLKQAVKQQPLLFPHMIQMLSEYLHFMRH